MTEGASGWDGQQVMEQIHHAVADGKLSASAADNIRRWLTEPRYAQYAPQVAAHVVEGRWRELDDAFWTIIPFGTGGRRGRMYPIGCNAINERTIGESAQGLADYVKSQVHDHSSLSCAIAYDTRHRSRQFAELCASIMVAAGFRVYFLDDYRATPELSFLIRHKCCDCGIMITASHNPPSDNAVKVYWSTGGQLIPPHDAGVIQRVAEVDRIDKVDFSEAVADGRIELCTAEVDRAYIEAVRQQSFGGPRDLKILYSPLHGVGQSAVCPVLAAAGFDEVEVFGPHQEPNGDFPNVPGHVSNPENVAVFDALIERARQSGAELVLATDPDCDRMGAAAPLTLDPAGPWQTLNGNQLGALLADYVLQMRQQQAALSPDHYVVKTLVTTEMIRRIADSYGVRTLGNLLVGFKWIAWQMDEAGPDRFVFGAEESHGYLVGQYARDKDGAVACLLMAELAARAKAAGKSVHQHLEALYRRHGYHAERLLNVHMHGSDGMRRMEHLMDRLRHDPPRSIGPLKVVQRRDYLLHQVTTANGQTRPLEGPEGNLVFLDLAEPGNYIAVRPSGTEPKVKCYMFTWVPPEQVGQLPQCRKAMAQRLDGFEQQLKELAASV